MKFAQLGGCGSWASQREHGRCLVLLANGPSLGVKAPETALMRKCRQSFLVAFSAEFISVTLGRLRERTHLCKGGVLSLSARSLPGNLINWKL